MNAAQRIFEIIDSKPDVVERADPVDLDIKGEITFNNVSFGYEPNKMVLKNISFNVKQGQVLGIVGKSGAGKSTLVNLISRLYDADSGEILIGGVNIKDISFKSLHGAVAMVSQETYIFMGTIAENIAYARPDASREEIIRAAQIASAHPFISALPDGYDTIIGAGGRELSGGERQRISIARAVLADPRILVLDEATASVDTETERAIQEALEKLVRGRTTISIAHRLSTLRNADYLIVLKDGEIVESGTHQELAAAKGSITSFSASGKGACNEGYRRLTKGADHGMLKERAVKEDDIIAQQKKVVEDIISVRLITEENSVFERTEGGFVSLEFTDGNGEKEFYSRVSVHRCFPYSDPDRYISVREPDRDGREIGLIEDLNKMSKKTKEMILEQLELRYLRP